jgi:hypothetical protein
MHGSDHLHYPPLPIPHLDCFAAGLYAERIRFGALRWQIPTTARAAPSGSPPHTAAQRAAELEAQRLELTERLLDLFPTLYLILASIIQGVAFSYLVGAVHDQLDHLTLLVALQAVAALVLITAVWSLGAFGAFALVWYPTVLDGLIPFLFGATEVLLCLSVGENMARWLGFAVGAAFMAFITLLYIYRRAPLHARNTGVVASVMQTRRVNYLPSSGPPSCLCSGYLRTKISCPVRAPQARFWCSSSSPASCSTLGSTGAASSATSGQKECLRLKSDMTHVRYRAFAEGMSLAHVMPHAYAEEPFLQRQTGWRQLIHVSALLVGHVHVALRIHRHTVGVLKRRYAIRPVRKEFPSGIELLDARVTGVSHVHVAATVDREPSGPSRLAECTSLRAPLQKKCPRR